jgi:hypothetical protein
MAEINSKVLTKEELFFGNAIKTKNGKLSNIKVSDKF